MAASTTIDTLAPTEGEDACVTRVCEEDCDDCHDAEAPLLDDLVIISKALQLLNCMHKNANFSSENSLPKIVANLQKTVFTRKVFRKMF